jgi:hypothetical protein
MLNWQQIESNTSKYRSEFEKASPFPHVLIENFFDPDRFVIVEEGFEAALSHKSHASKKKHKNVLLKTGTPKLFRMTPEQVEVYTLLHSSRFADLLMKITGIDPIFTDIENRGGGLHSSARGAYLNIHTDFNFHPSKGTHRRLNLIVYANSVWKEEWGGALELWNSDVSRCEAKFFPNFNSAILFETSEISFHGHPVPMTCPEGVTRKSITSYYYSKWPEGLERRKETNYVLTPSQDESLRRQVINAINAGVRTWEEASKEATEWAPNHVKRIFREEIGK